MQKKVFSQRCSSPASRHLSCEGMGMSIFKKSVTLMTHIFTVGISGVDTSVELHADPIFAMLTMVTMVSVMVSLLKLALKLLAVEGLKLHF